MRGIATPIRYLRSLDARRRGIIGVANNGESRAGSYDPTASHLRACRPQCATNADDADKRAAYRQSGYRRYRDGRQHRLWWTTNGRQGDSRYWRSPGRWFGAAEVERRRHDSVTTRDAATSPRVDLEVVLRSHKRVPASLLRVGKMQLAGLTELGDYAIDLEKIRRMVPVR